MKTRVSFRINSIIGKLLGHWKEYPESRLGGGSIAKHISISMLNLVRMWVQQSISEVEIIQLAEIGDDRSGWYRVDVTAETHTLVNSLISDTKLSMSAFVRAAIVLSPQMANREALEQEYLGKGGVGDPTLMSDDFLHLWCKYKNEGPSTDGVKIVRAIRDLEIRFQATLKKLDRLEVLFDTYGINGILKSSHAPKKSEILASEGKALRALCKRWKVSITSQTSDAVIKRELLSKFGYQQRSYNDT